MTKRDLNALRREIERDDFLWIVDEASSDCELAVHDRRPDIGNNHGTWITSRESLDYLVRHGAEAWCESRFNGGGDPIAALAGSLTASTLAAVLADLEERRPDDAALDRTQRAFADQLASLEGDDAAERMRPEFRNSPAGRMKVQFV